MIVTINDSELGAAHLKVPADVLGEAPEEPDERARGLFHEPPE